MHADLIQITRPSSSGTLDGLAAPVLLFQTRTSTRYWINLSKTYYRFEEHHINNVLTVEIYARLCVRLYNHHHTMCDLINWPSLSLA